MNKLWAYAKQLRRRVRRLFSRSELSRLSWQLYTTSLSAFASPSDRGFIETGVRVGRLPQEHTERLSNIIGAAHRTLLTIEDHHQGYVYNGSIYGDLQSINSAFNYFQLGSDQFAAIGEACRALAPEIHGCLGTGWRVVNTKILRTHAGTGQVGQNLWHSDQFGEGLQKVLIYLSPVGPTTGTTEIRLGDGSAMMIEGPPGTYVLFNPSRLVHRGLPPEEGTRLIVELTIMPALVTDHRPVFAGQNAAYPLFPWIRACPFAQKRTARGH